MNIFKRILIKVKYLGIRKIYYSLLFFLDFILSKFSDLDIINSGSYYQSLIKRNQSKKLIEFYEGNSGHNLNYKQYFLGFGLLHYSLLRNVKPLNILCIGSKKGFIPAILALGCKDNNYGHVDFVDAGYDQNQHDKHWSGIGFWKNNESKKHFDKIGISKYITTHVMTTQEYFNNNRKKKYQYIYVDGDHSYNGVKLDYSLFWPNLEKNGLIIFHDIVADGYLDEGKFGVKKFWKEIAKKNSLIFPFPKDSGLGIIQKK